MGRRSAYSVVRRRPRCPKLIIHSAYFLTVVFESTCLKTHYVFSRTAVRAGGTRAVLAKMFIIHSCLVDLCCRYSPAAAGCKPARRARHNLIKTTTINAYLSATLRVTAINTFKIN